MKRRSAIILAVGAVFLCVMLLLPLPAVTTAAGEVVYIDWRGRSALGVLGFTALLWATEAFPLAVSSLIGCILLPLLGVVPWERVVNSGLSGDILPFLMGVMIMSEGIRESGLADRLSAGFASRMALDGRMVILAFLILGCGLSMLIGNLTAAAVIAPIAVSVLEANDAVCGKSNFGKALMIACVWGPIIGSIGTPVGSSSSVITMEFLNDLADVHVSFAQWMSVGIPSALLLLVPAWLILLTCFPLGKESVKTRTTATTINERRRLSRGEWSVVASMLTTWILWLTSRRIEQATGVRVPMSLGAVIGGLIYILTGSEEIEWANVEKSVDLSIFVTVTAGLSLGSAIHESSAGIWLANVLFSGILNMSAFPRAFLTTAIVCVLKMFFSSNTATASIIVPILISLVGSENAIPIWQFIAPAGLASSLAIILVTSCPTNFIAYKSGYFTVEDMAKAGALLAVAASLVVAVVTTFFM